MLNKKNVGWGIAVVAVIALGAWAFMGSTASATAVDACNQTFEYTKGTDFSDGRVEIDFVNTGASGNPDTIGIEVNIGGGYELVSVHLNVQNDDEGGFVDRTSSFDEDGGTYNPPGETITSAKVVVKKVCTEVCNDNTATNYQELVAGQTVANNALCVYPVDVCTNIDGLQTTVPEGYESLSEGQCTPIPPPVDYCSTVPGTQPEDFDCPPLGGEVTCEGVLNVTGIETLDGSATANNTYEGGWSFLFDVTIPTCETDLAMKFADWTGAGTIPAGGNMRISSAQASNGPVDVTAADTYTSALDITTDLDGSTAGIQVEVKVEVKVPVGTPTGAYSTTYGIQTN